MTKNYTAKQIKRDSLISIDGDCAGCMPNEGNKMTNTEKKLRHKIAILISILDEREKEYTQSAEEYGTLSIVGSLNEGYANAYSIIKCELKDILHK